MLGVDVSGKHVCRVCGAEEDVFLYGDILCGECIAKERVAESQTDNDRIEDSPCPWCQEAPQIWECSGGWVASCYNRLCEGEAATGFCKSAEEARSEWYRAFRRAQAESFIGDNQCGLTQSRKG